MTRSCVHINPRQLHGEIQMVTLFRNMYISLALKDARLDLSKEITKIYFTYVV